MNNRRYSYIYICIYYGKVKCCPKLWNILSNKEHLAILEIDRVNQTYIQ